MGKSSFKGNKNILTEELEALLPQKPNKTFLFTGIPAGVLIYKWQEPKYLKQRAVWQKELDSLAVLSEDTMGVFLNAPLKFKKKLARKIARQQRKREKWITKGNGLMRFLGLDPPVYFLANDAQQNSKKIKTYLFNHGFWRSQVGFTTDTAFGFIKTTYHVKEGIPYKLRNVNILTNKDATIDSLLKKTKNESFLKSGDNYSYSNIDSEIKRIETLMQNNGYMGFSKEYLRPLGKNGGFIIDTNIVAKETDSLYKNVDIRELQVNYPRFKNSFQQYKYGTTKFVVRTEPDEYDLLHPVENDTVLYKGVQYFFDENKYKPQVLGRKLSMASDSIVKRSDIMETQRQLSLLDQFQFIRFEDIDTLSGRFSPMVTVIPFKKYEGSFELGGNTVQGAIGVSGSATLKSRNVGQSLGNLNVTGRIAYDLQAGYIRPDTLVQTLEAGLNTSFTLPRLFLIDNLSWANKIRQKTPQTIFSFDLSYSNRLPDFKRQGVRTSMIYSWRKSDNESFTVTPFDLSYIRTETSKDFADRLAQLERDFGNPLIRSFQKNALVSSISAGYRKNTYDPRENKRAMYLNLFAETGGNLSGLFFSQNSSLQTYKFLKLNAEYRAYRPLGLRSSVVFRGNLGLLWSGGATKAAPYEKYFTLGGSTSMRAWKTRRLGLGAAYPNIIGQEKLADGSTIAIPRFQNQADPANSSFDYRFEQLGDVMIETNAEFRARMFRLGGFDFNYAFFLDIGNVWALPKNTDYKNDSNGRNSLFTFSDFYKQLAVGTGTGLRIDFSFFIMRLDFGVKVYDPARIYPIIDPVTKKLVEMRDERFVLPKMSFRPSSPFFVQPQFGINYPF